MGLDTFIVREGALNSAFASRPFSLLVRVLHSGAGFGGALWRVTRWNLL